MTVTYCDECGAELPAKDEDRADMLPLLARGLKYQIALRLRRHNGDPPELCQACWIKALEDALNGIRVAAQHRTDWMLPQRKTKGATADARTRPDPSSTVAVTTNSPAGTPNQSTRNRRAEDAPSKVQADDR